MKLSILLIMVGFGAAANVTVYTDPYSPTVTFGDLLQNPDSEAEIKANGPWMEVTPSVRNDFSEPIEILSLVVSVKTPEGKSASKKIAFAPFTLEPTITRVLPKNFVESIPVETTQVLDGTATVEFKRGDTVETRTHNFKTH